MLEEGVTATNYTISYSNTDSNCFTDSSTGIITDRMSYYLSGLEEDTEYIATVMATLSDGWMWMDSVSAITMTAGVYQTVFISFLYPSQTQFPRCACEISLPPE